VEFNILYGKGISRNAEILDMAVEHDIIQKSGSWYRYDGEPIGQGSDKTIEFLESDPNLLKNIEQQIRLEMNGEVPEEEEKEEEKEAAEES
jgi:recombination protein RecA